MLERTVTEEEKRKIAEKIKREFLGCSSLQEIHFYRYIKESQPSPLCTIFGQKVWRAFDEVLNNDGKIIGLECWTSFILGTLAEITLKGGKGYEL